MFSARRSCWFSGRTGAGSLAHGEDTLRGACHPGQHAGQHAEHQGDGDDRSGPRDVEVVEIVVESDQQRLREADVLGGDDESQREGAQHEDADRDERTDDDGLGVVARRILHVHHVNAHHLHTRIEEEDAAGQHEVVEFRQVGEEALRHVHMVVPAGRDVDDAEDDQQSRGMIVPIIPPHLLIFPTHPRPGAR